MAYEAKAKRSKPRITAAQCRLIILRDSYMWNFYIDHICVVTYTSMYMYGWIHICMQLQRQQYWRRTCLTHYSNTQLTRIQRSLSLA